MSLRVEKGQVKLLYLKKEKKWQIEVGGLEEDDRFVMPAKYPTPGDAVNAATEWASQRNMTVLLNNHRFRVYG